MRKEPTYWQIFTAAGRAVGLHPVLWILGLLAVFGGQFVLPNFVGKFFLFSAAPREFLDSIWWLLIPWGELFSGGGLPWAVWLLVIGGSLALAVIFLSLAGRGALLAALEGWFTRGTRPTFARAWQRGVKHFPRLLVIALGERLISASLLLSAVLLLLGDTTTLTVAAWLGLVIILAGLFGLAMAVAVISVFSAAFVVTAEEPVGRAISRAAALFFKHLLVSIETSLLLLATALVLLFLVLAAALLSLIPAFALGLLGGLLSLGELFVAGLMLAVIIFVVLIALLGGGFNAWTSAVWMHLFVKLRGEPITPRLLHWLERVARRVR